MSFLYVSFLKHLQFDPETFLVGCCILHGQFFCSKISRYCPVLRDLNTNKTISVHRGKLCRIWRTIFYFYQNQFAKNSRYFGSVLLADFFPWHFLFYYPEIDDSYLPYYHDFKGLPSYKDSVSKTPCFFG